MDTKTELIHEFIEKVKNANKETTKKEAFKDLLNRLYNRDSEILKIVDKISSGAEKTVLNIPRKGKDHLGSADTLYNNVIIEFENDLNKTLKHAKEQLAGYFLGQYKSGMGNNYILIASDFINWKVFAPDISCMDKLEKLNENELILNEVPSASFILDKSNTQDFYYYIDRFLFKEEKRKATLKDVQEAFGFNSNIFLECFRVLKHYFPVAKRYGEVQISLEQWKKFLSVAYGSFEENTDTFIIHTYLSVFSKMLAYSIVSNDNYIDDQELRGILDGDIFKKYNIENFVENDFFHWIATDRALKNLKKVFRLIAQEITTFDFTNVEEDILKGVYQELIDLDTRHALGEYYTPDWLCEKIVNEFKFYPYTKVLDPACGSGSFLRAVIHKLKNLSDTYKIESLNDQVFGIDIHPLSVQIAKTTLVLAYGSDITNAKRPIHLNVYLSNTLLAPEGVKSLWGSEFAMAIDKKIVKLNTQILDDNSLFNNAIEVCNELAEQTMHKAKESRETFANILTKHYKKGGLNDLVIDSFYDIYLGIKQTKERDRDDIWKFIIQNLYKPYFLSKKFDYVVGNPPWLTFKAIKNEDYQDTLNTIAEKYSIKPERQANFTHLEIAAIFFAYCSNYFLKKEGEIGFVLPRSFFYADHHDNTRSGKAKGFKISEIWDLNDVKPLFRIPSCVLFAKKTDGKRNIGSKGVSGYIFNGKLPEHNCNAKVANNYLSQAESVWYYTKQGRSSAFSNKRQRKKQKENIYKGLFKQGATIVPRNFYFIQLDQEPPPDYTERILNIKTCEAINKSAKPPWKDNFLTGQIESNFIFNTALAWSMLPFALYNPDKIVLPIVIEIDDRGDKTIRLHDSNSLRKDGYIYASKWFGNVENLWDILKTERNKDISASDYLNWQNKLITQNLNFRCLVLYTSSAKDAHATIIDRETLDLEFIAESKVYLFGTNDINEAYYLVAILNSNTPNNLMKDYQSKGLFGPRDIHKKILDIYFPQFDSEIESHNKLAELSKEAHNKVKKYIDNNPPESTLTPTKLGRYRSEIRQYINKELLAIDKIVKKIMKE